MTYEVSSEEAENVPNRFAVLNVLLQSPLATTAFVKFPNIQYTMDNPYASEKNISDLGQKTPVSEQFRLPENNVARLLPLNRPLEERIGKLNRQKEYYDQLLQDRKGGRKYRKQTNKKRKVGKNKKTIKRIKRMCRNR